MFFDTFWDKILKTTENILEQGVSVDDFIIGFNKYLQKILKIVAGLKIDGHDDIIGFIKNNKNSICELYVVRIMELCLQFLAKLKFVNHLGIESYLVSVVGSEIPKSWPIESNDIIPWSISVLSNLDIINSTYKRSFV